VPADLSGCRECHCLAARRHARAITRLYDARLRPHGLRSTQFSVLVALSLVGPLRVTRLADALGLERTTLTRIAAILERDGLIRPVAGSDGRARQFALTAAAKRRLERALPAWREAQADARALLDAAPYHPHAEAVHRGTRS
jgi:DNA-binding MarR family transcriptional regulator